ncbi:MAG: hypothetical protein AAFV53_22870 [Myxococcota bacterium]
MSTHRGSIYQHSQFESDLVNGQIIRSMRGAGTNHADLVVFQLDGPYRHHFSLDIDAVFWGEWPADALGDSYDEHVDLGSRLGVVGRRVGAVLAFPAVADGNPAVHIHLDAGEKLVFSPSKPRDSEPGCRIQLTPGSVAESYQELFLAHDDRARADAPDGLSWQHLRALVRTTCVELEARLGRPVRFSEQGQDARFLADVIVGEGSISQSHQQSVRFSKCGWMVSVTDPGIDPGELRVIREVVRRHNFIFVPHHLLQRPHHASDSWWVRFFESG